LATEANGTPILFANSVDVAADGKVYFSDASTKFGAKQWGGTYPASLLDILEHGSHGRLLVYDPTTGKATTLVAGLNFAERPYLYWQLDDAGAGPAAEGQRRALSGVVHGIVLGNGSQEVIERWDTLRAHDDRETREGPQGEGRGSY
jgi:hypothetical protein